MMSGTVSKVESLTLAKNEADNVASCQLSARAMLVSSLQVLGEEIKTEDLSELVELLGLALKNKIDHFYTQSHSSVTLEAVNSHYSDLKNLLSAAKQYLEFSKDPIKHQMHELLSIMAFNEQVKKLESSVSFLLESMPEPSKPEDLSFVRREIQKSLEVKSDFFKNEKVDSVKPDRVPNLSGVEPEAISQSFSPKKYIVPFFAGKIVPGENHGLSKGLFIEKVSVVISPDGSLLSLKNALGDDWEKFNVVTEYNSQPFRSNDTEVRLNMPLVKTHDAQTLQVPFGYKIKALCLLDPDGDSINKVCSIHKSPFGTHELSGAAGAVSVELSLIPNDDQAHLTVSQWEALNKYSYCFNTPMPEEMRSAISHASNHEDPIARALIVANAFKAENPIYYCDYNHESDLRKAGESALPIVAGVHGGDCKGLSFLLANYINLGGGCAVVVSGSTAREDESSIMFKPGHCNVLICSKDSIAVLDPTTWVNSDFTIRRLPLLPSSGTKDTFYNYGRTLRTNNNLNEDESTTGHQIKDELHELSIKHGHLEPHRSSTFVAIDKALKEKSLGVLNDYMAYLTLEENDLNLLSRAGCALMTQKDCNPGVRTIFISSFIQSALKLEGSSGYRDFVNVIPTLPLLPVDIGLLLILEEDDNSPITDQAAHVRFLNYLSDLIPISNNGEREIDSRIPDGMSLITLCQFLDQIERTVIDPSECQKLINKTIKNMTLFFEKNYELPLVLLDKDKSFDEHVHAMYSYIDYASSELLERLDLKNDGTAGERLAKQINEYLSGRTDLFLNNPNYIFLIEEDLKIRLDPNLGRAELLEYYGMIAQSFKNATQPMRQVIQDLMIDTEIGSCDEIYHRYTEEAEYIFSQIDQSHVDYEVFGKSLELIFSDDLEGEQEKNAKRLAAEVLNYATFAHIEFPLSVEDQDLLALFDKGIKVISASVCPNVIAECARADSRQFNEFFISWLESHILQIPVLIDKALIYVKESIPQFESKLYFQFLDEVEQEHILTKPHGLKWISEPPFAKDLSIDEKRFFSEIINCNLYFPDYPSVTPYDEWSFARELDKRKPYSSRELLWRVALQLAGTPVREAFDLLDSCKKAISNPNISNASSPLSAFLQRVGKQSTAHRTDSFSHLSAYQFGEDTKQVNWKVSGRSDQIVMNRYLNGAADKQMSIHVDLEYIECSPFDHSEELVNVMTAIMLAHETGRFHSLVLAFRGAEILRMTKKDIEKTFSNDKGSEVPKWSGVASWVYEKAVACYEMKRFREKNVEFLETPITLYSKPEILRETEVLVFSSNRHLEATSRYYKSLYHKKNNNHVSFFADRRNR